MTTVKKKPPLKPTSRWSPGSPIVHELTGNNPRAWHSWVETLTHAAKRVHTDDTGFPPLPSGAEGMLAINAVYAMLLGYAIECALKGLWVEADASIFPRRRTGGWAGTRGRWLSAGGRIAANRLLVIGPGVPAVDGDGGHPPRIEQHRVTARRRELILRQELTNSHERQASFLQTDQLHPSESNPHVSIGVIREDDLVGWQRHAQSVWEHDERAWRAVSDDWKRRRTIPFTQERRGRCEGDEQWDVRHAGRTPS